MKILVAGVGAMGSIYAALFADVGHDVWAIDQWVEHANAIANNGLKIEGASGDRTVRNIRVVQTASQAGPVDIVIIATKASGVETAAKAVADALTPSTIIITIQNGLGAGERIARYLPAEQILLGVAEGFGASIVAPGHVHHFAMKMIRIGSMRPVTIQNSGSANRQEEKINKPAHHSALTDANIESVAAMWREAGFNVTAFDDIAQLIWEKFICNVAYSAPCTVFKYTIAELLNNSESRKISQACAVEAWQVAQAKKIHLSFTDPVEYVTDFGKRLGDARPSMLLDHIDSRKSEVDAINGMVPVVAVEEGLTAPYNEVLTAIVRSRETAWQR